MVASHCHYIVYLLVTANYWTLPEDPSSSYLIGILTNTKRNQKETFVASSSRKIKTCFIKALRYYCPENINEQYNVMNKTHLSHLYHLCHWWTGNPEDEQEYFIIKHFLIKKLSSHKLCHPTTFYRLEQTYLQFSKYLHLFSHPIRDEPSSLSPKLL